MLDYNTLVSCSLVASKFQERLLKLCHLLTPDFLSVWLFFAPGQSLDFLYIFPIYWNLLKTKLLNLWTPKNKFGVSWILTSIRSLSWKFWRNRTRTDKKQSLWKKVECTVTMVTWWHMQGHTQERSHKSVKCAKKIFIRKSNVMQHWVTNAHRREATHVKRLWNNVQLNTNPCATWTDTHRKEASPV